jgi:hypothetical protein
MFPPRLVFMEMILVAIRGNENEESDIGANESKQIFS